MHFITLLAVFIAIVCPDVLGSQQTQFVSTGPSVSRSKSNELTPWQWCEGCVRTVSVFGVHLAKEADRLMKIHQVTPVDPDTKVDMNCEIPDFHQYQDFVKVSCGIIVKNNHESVVEVIRGTEKEVTMSSLQDVRVISAKSRQICVDHVHACNASYFDITSIVGNKRNKCAACTLVAHDIDKVRRVSNAKQSSPSAMLEKDIMKYCKAYNREWVEDVCEEMTEDHIDYIEQVVATFNEEASLGLNRIQTFPQVVCEKLYKCDADLNSSRKKSTKKGSQKKRP